MPATFSGVQKSATKCTLCPCRQRLCRRLFWSCRRLFRKCGKEPKMYMMSLSVHTLSATFLAMFRKYRKAPRMYVMSLSANTLSATFLVMSATFSEVQKRAKNVYYVLVGAYLVGDFFGLVGDTSGSTPKHKKRTSDTTTNVHPIAPFLPKAN